MSIRTFHGGCIGCQSQYVYGLERCYGCQYFHTDTVKIDWSKPELYIPIKKALIDIIYDDKNEFNKYFTGKYDNLIIKQLSNGTYVAFDEYRHIHYTSDNKNDLEEMFNLVWTPKRVRDKIEKQLRIGTEVTEEFLLNYGEFFNKELKIHPKFNEEIIPLIIKNELYSILPEETTDLFIF